MRGSVADEHIEPGEFHRHCGTCGKGLRKIGWIEGLRAHWNGLLPTDAVHTDRECFARWMKNEGRR